MAISHIVLSRFACSSSWYLLEQKETKFEKDQQVLQNSFPFINIVVVGREKKATWAPSDEIVQHFSTSHGECVGWSTSEIASVKEWFNLSGHPSLWRWNWEPSMAKKGGNSKKPIHWKRAKRIDCKRRQNWEKFLIWNKFGFYSITSISLWELPMILQ